VSRPERTRIAVLSDIHGSLAALEAVAADIDRQAPDLVLHVGDLVVNGPMPAEVVDLVRDRGWRGVLGNTDEILWTPGELQRQVARAPKLHDLLHVLFDETGPATRELLGEKRTEWLRLLPLELREVDLLLLHASPGDPWRAPMPDATDDALFETYGPLGAELVVYGHIHRPFVRRLPGLTVANSGSVGQPYDGDWRASYLLIDGGVATVRRVEYDLDRELADLARSGYPRASWLARMRRSGRPLPVA
jgi:putative phosphoesterase